MKLSDVIDLPAHEAIALVDSIKASVARIAEEEKQARIVAGERLMTNAIIDSIDRMTPGGYHHRTPVFEEVIIMIFKWVLAVSLFAAILWLFR